MCEVKVLYDGYSVMTGKDQMSANCSCTLIKGDHNVIVDTMTAWDSQKIISALEAHNIRPENINYVISTHGHSDHIGNNNLFLKAKHIVGFSVSFQDEYYTHPFDKGEEYKIDDNIKVIPTPGHTLSDVTVIVKTTDDVTVAIAGDLFERFEDIDNPSLWLEAGSEDPVQQMKNRSKVADTADWIVPGHGPKFQITEEIRRTLKKQMGEETRS
ncbi:metallo-beta-lactamase domain-containing protein 1-like [Trichoplusia ni]|uniref:Metallo-beta-lactamase domain-containing protein 1 n=1 Tax=Trichoplusia ni TaxID=7111 RepID=A0A7E5X2G4_TRINI|nr:metallo-beta-lactamase domain-containing protein 1-like [Trichoplusia ni]XP_026731982.1 metallo-beta-lactamase domain-containing protein 1-like [Trichoplusia ni]XP_026746575.1 metallo-beta-lactamase domain-containing protein 1-like [Trichoplusia ni]XP_026746576.1 metallo-beta-lactamase domain-containing protein 1-like [Trichoplusia ni]